MDPLRLAMWSGPRNISTTMMRSFENRRDCAVVDEPFYAHFLKETGEDHPMGAAVIASQPTDWRDVVRRLTTDNPAPVFFQKHMCHHITRTMELDWLAELEHFFLIRDPARMIPSYAEKMETISLEALGLPQQLFLFEQITEQKGAPPPVLDAHDILTDPRTMLSTLCAALAMPFDEAMLSWPSGPRKSDGVWGPHWYNVVNTSTGFRPPPETSPEIHPDHAPLLIQARPIYEALYRHRLTP